MILLSGVLWKLNFLSLLDHMKSWKYSLCVARSSTAVIQGSFKAMTVPLIYNTECSDFDVIGDGKQNTILRPQLSLCKSLN